VLRQAGPPRVLLSSSRSASLSAFLARVPSVGFIDFEHTELRPFALGVSLWLPDVLRDVALPQGICRVARFYPGLKENLYLDEWRFDRAAERRAPGVGEGDYLVVTRPPATPADYASPLSDRLWSAAP